VTNITCNPTVYNLKKQTKYWMPFGSVYFVYMFDSIWYSKLSFVQKNVFKCKRNISNIVDFHIFSTRVQPPFPHTPLWSLNCEYIFLQPRHSWILLKVALNQTNQKQIKSIKNKNKNVGNSIFYRCTSLFYWYFYSK
jgi:hypothetical protein